MFVWTVDLFAVILERTFFLILLVVYSVHSRVCSLASPTYAAAPPLFVFIRYRIL
jgi:hypothetical protein